MDFGGDSFFGMEDLSLGQALFMAEAEGVDTLVTTPQSRFNAALAEIKEQLAWAVGYDYDATDEINSILASHGINPHNLTATELARIESVI